MTNSRGPAVEKHCLRDPGSWGSQIPRQSAHKGSKVVGPTHQPPYTPLPPGDTDNIHSC